MAISCSLAPPRDIARRNEWAVYIGTFFASLGFSFVSPLMPLLVLDLLDGDQSLAGLWVSIAIGMSPALTALTGPWWGALSDRVGQKLMIQRALLAIGAAVALTAVIAH